MATILICEDEAPVADLLAQVCSDAGHTSVTTDNANDCMAKGMEHKPKLMFLDVMLPGGVSGYDLCRHFRDHEDTKDAHIVIITARTGPAVERTTARAGADELVYKPFRLETIEHIIARAFGDSSES